MLPPILLLLALVFLLVTALVGLIRGWKRFMPSLIIIAASALVAFVATLILKNVLGGVIAGYVQEMLNGILEPGAYDSLKQSVPTAAAFIDALPTALLAPFVFAVCYVVILIAAEIIRAIVMAIVGRKKEKSAVDKKAKRKDRLIGLGAGAVGGLVMAFACLLPLIGYIGTVSSAVDGLNEISPEIMENIFADEESRVAYDNYVEPILNDPYVRVSYTLGGKLAFDAVSTVNINGENYPFAKLVSTGLGISGHISPLINEEIPEYGDEQIEALDLLVDDLDGDVLLKSVCAEFISGLATAWENGEDFLGIEPLAAEGHFEPILNRTVSAFSGTNNETVIEDLRSVSDIVGTLIRYDAVALLGDENGSVKDVLAKEGFVTELCAAVQKNERMKPVFFEVAKLGVVLVSDVVGIPNDPETIYRNFLTGLADTVNAALPEYRESGDAAFFVKTLQGEFEKNGMTVSADAAAAIAGALLEKASVAGTVDADGIKRIFSDELLPALDPNGAYYAEAEALCADISSGKLTSSLATLEAIVDQMHEASISDAQTESQKFESVVISALLVMDSLEGDEDNFLFAVDAQAIEDVIVNLSLTETFGDAVSVLLKGICQSKMLTGTGFSAQGIYDDLMAGGYDNIANTLETVKHAVKMFETLSAPKNDSDSGSTADITENIQWIVSNMTPATSAILSNQINEETLKNYGVSEESAAPVSDLMTNMFDSMANETELTEEEYKRESDAINHLFTVATEMSSAGVGENVFDNSVASAKDIADTVLNSKVVSDALVNTAFDEEGELKEDPLATNVELGEADKSAMVDALNTYATENLPDAENPEAEIKKISALAAVFNLNIEIGADGTVTQK